MYRPYGENLYYYDVNSLYPYAALNDMPGLNCYKEQFINKKLLSPNLATRFGFYYCDIEAPLNNYLGLLPVKSKSGIYFPIGKWSGLYFSEQLKFAQHNGYKVNLNIWRCYVTKLFYMKS